MDSETTSSAAPDPLTAMLQNAIIEAERSEFSNSARDTIKVTVNNYNFPKDGENHESPDVIDFLRNALPPFLTEIRKNNQSQYTVDETSGADGSDSPVSSRAVTTLDGNPVDVIDIVPQEPSSFPVTSVADRYTRSLLKCLSGYALYDPQPLSEHSMEYLLHGVNVGDVGFVRSDGVFDFLFNVCPSKNGLINPPMLPDGFCLESVEHSATRAGSPLPRKTRFFLSPIIRTKSGEYICEGSEGGILELPEGAVEEEAMNILPFEKLAARLGVQWYKYTMARGRKISNGSLYIITSSTKCSHWGIAVFDRKCARGEGLRFKQKISFPFGKSTSSKYHWKGSHTFPTKLSMAGLNQGDSPNQCVFLRGYKIMIRHDIFDDLCNDQPRGSDPVIPSSSSQAGSSTMTRQRATRIRGGGGSDPMLNKLNVGGLLSKSTIPTMTKSDEVVLHANFNPSPVHPSDLVNAALLSQNPDAKVALTHDNVWCDLSRDNFPKLNCATLINIAKSYINSVDEYGCVSLQKITDSRNVLDESSRSLQGIETLVLRNPLTTSKEGFSPMPTKIFPTLPREVVERIFLLLDTNSMLTCRLVNREFNEVIRSSMLLYFLVCKAAGVTDYPKSLHSYAERITALLKREEAWRKLKPVFEMKIKLDPVPPLGSFYCVTGGAYFQSDKNRNDLRYCNLPSSPEDNLKWIRVPIHGPEENWHGTFVSFGMSLYKHDLIINFISSDIGNQTGIQQYSLDLVLLKFSTGEYHPLARHPRIHVQRSSLAQPFIVSAISGNNIALILHSRDDTFCDKLIIFDWQTGHKLLHHEAAVNAYFSLIFVSPEVLLVPNLTLSHFEVWKLPPSNPDPEPPVQILSLKIPAVSPDYSIITLKISGSQSPSFRSIPYLPSRPLLSSPQHSMIVANFRMSSRSPLSRRQHVAYTLIMNCRTLLDTIQKLTSPSFLEQQQDLPTWLTNEITLHKIADPDDACVRLGVQSRLVTMIPHPRPPPQPRASRTFATSQTSSTLYTSIDTFSSSIPSGSSTTSSTYRYNFPCVEWADWGPPISRWLPISGLQARWGMNCAGQRYAFMVPPRMTGGKSKIAIADFNPHNLRRNTETKARVRGGSKDNGGRGNSEEGKEEEELEMLNHGGVFSEEVYMGLKCAVYHTPDEYNFEVVMMDGMRLLGLKSDLRGIVRKVKVLYIG